MPFYHGYGRFWLLYSAVFSFFCRWHVERANSEPSFSEEQRTRLRVKLDSRRQKVHHACTCAAGDPARTGILQVCPVHTDLHSLHAGLQVFRLGA